MAVPEQAEFLACRDCNVLQPLATSFLRCVDAAEAAAAQEACEEFVVGHCTHRTARLRRCGSECYADRPLWDPMATVTFVATDGEHTYVVTAGRSSIDAPRAYRFQPGTLAVESTEIAVDTADLRCGLDLLFHPHALRPTKVERFLAAVDALIHRIDLEHIEIAFDVADDPAVSIARMPDSAYSQLLDQCEQIFDSWELLHVTAFLKSNRDADGLLALRVRRHLAILPG
jgi:hypothetical protein